MAGQNAVSQKMTRWSYGRCSAGRVGFGVEDATDVASGVGENEAMGSDVVAVGLPLHADRKNIDNKIKQVAFIYLSSIPPAGQPFVRGSQMSPPLAVAWTYLLPQV